MGSDSKQSIPVAVMARNINGVSKEVKILAGVAEILMTPISAAGMKIQMILNGQQEIVQVNLVWLRSSGMSMVWKFCTSRGTRMMFTQSMLFNNISWFFLMENTPKSLDHL